jgi:antitoxin MazE
MKARLVRIGNSRGVRLPKTIIAQAGLTEEVELGVRNGTVVISRATTARSGWAAAASQIRQRGEDQLLNAPTPTHFDEKEWEW